MRYGLLLPVVQVTSEVRTLLNDKDCRSSLVKQPVKCDPYSMKSLVKLPVKCAPWAGNLRYVAASLGVACRCGLIPLIRICRGILKCSDSMRVIVSR